MGSKLKAEGRKKGGASAIYHLCSLLVVSVT